MHSKLVLDLRCLSAVLFSLAIVSPLAAQNPAPAAAEIKFPAPSPASTLKQRVGLTDIEIVYSRPGVKGRKIFGGLEAWGTVWRAGANNSTKITFSTPVEFGGTKVPAGTYALFAKLEPEEWTVILNKAPGQGAYKYDAKDDVARATVKTTRLADVVETFTIDLNHIRDESAVLTMSWENTRVAVPIKVDVVKDLVAKIEAIMASDEPKKPYAQAAMFYLEHKLDLKKAAEWMDAAIAKQPASFPLIYRKAKIQAALGDKTGAVATAKKSIELASKETGPVKEEYTRLNEALIESLK